MPEWMMQVELETAQDQARALATRTGRLEWMAVALAIRYARELPRAKRGAVLASALRCAQGVTS